jgi:ADP-ribose pyrophosphatase YjhB (NUDIX family)
MSQTKYASKWMAAGAIFTDSDGKILIVKPTYKEGWEIPGGLIEKDESPAQACAREIKEELGIDFVPGRLLCVDYRSNTDDRGDRIMFIFDGGIIGDRVVFFPPNELSEYRFVTMDAIPFMFNERLARRIPKAVEAISRGVCIYLENGNEA